MLLREGARCDRESLSKDAVSKRLAPAGPWGEVWRVNGTESWSHLQPQGKGLSSHWLPEGWREEQDLLGEMAPVRPKAA